MKNRAVYPHNWPSLAWRCKEAAGWCCQICGVGHGTRRQGRYTGLWYRVALHAAHLDHDPWNPEPRLMAMCEQCHGRYDWRWRARLGEVYLQRLRHKLYLKLGRGKAGQLDVMSS